MGRIHGNYVIRRRSKIDKRKYYTDYRPEIQQDFYNICGYCGKSKECLFEEHELDHFVPKDIDKDRENDYFNLVYACKKCNGSKQGDWPTKDKNKPNENGKGYCDPATEEFDTHLGRDDEGNIFYKTEIGNYMYKRFHFDIRPISYVWKLMQLIHMEEELKNKTDKSLERLEILDKIEELRKYLKYENNLHE